MVMEIDKAEQMSAIEYIREPRPYDRVKLTCEMLMLATQMFARTQFHVTHDEVEALISAIGAVPDAKAEAVLELIRKSAHAVMECPDAD